MALDFHRLDNNEYLFGLDDSKYAHLEKLFVTFQEKTGIFMNPYGDITLSVGHQKVILKIIDTWISHADLNRDKQKTITITWFRAMLDYFSNKGVEMKLLGD